MNVARFLLGWVAGTAAVLLLLNERVDIPPEDVTKVVVGSFALMFMAALPLARR